MRDLPPVHLTDLWQRLGTPPLFDTLLVFAIADRTRIAAGRIPLP